MATDILSTSNINSLVYSYQVSEAEKFLTPLNTRKTKYQSLSSAYSELQTKLNSLKSALTDLTTDTTAFTKKTAASSSSQFITTSSDTSAVDGTYSLRVNQLAKSDISKSATITADTAVTDKAGTYMFKIGSGDNTGYVSLALTAAETNETINTKIANAVNSSTKATAYSSRLTASAENTMAGSFSFTYNGTTTSIAYDYSSGGYTNASALDDLVTKFSGIAGITASKETAADGSVSLKLVAADSKKDILIENADPALGLNGTFRSASLLAVGSAFSPSTGNTQFSLSARSTGFDNKLALTDIDGTLSSDLSLSRVYTDSQLNAKFVFNGVAIERNANTFSDLVSGVTFNLKSTMVESDTDVAVTVGQDVTASRAKLDTFISKFNDVYTNIKNKMSSGLSSTRGVFVGDPSASALLGILQNTAISKVSGIPSGELDYLSKIGITFNTATGLSVSDATTLTSALTNTPDQVTNMFTSTSGIATLLLDKTSNYTSVGGILSSLSRSYQTNISSIDSKIQSTQTRIEKSAESLRKQYERLQTQMATLLSTQASWYGYTSSYY